MFEYCFTHLVQFGATWRQESFQRTGCLKAKQDGMIQASMAFETTRSNKSQFKGPHDELCSFLYRG